MTEFTTVENLEKAEELLKEIMNYLLPFSQRKCDKKLEKAISELNDLIEFCNQNEFVYVDEE